MPSGIENNVGYFTALKVGDIYGNNYVTIDKDGVQAFHGTSHLEDESTTVDVFKSIRIGYDASNRLDITCSSVGAGAITMTGSSDSLTLQTSDGDITINAGANIVLAPVAGKAVILNSRVSTTTLAGSAISIDATTSQYGEGVELRYNISDWADTYTITEGVGALIRMETNESSTNSLYGAQMWGVANNVNVGNLWGGFAYAYVKGTGAKTITNIYAFQPEISFDAGSGTNTITDACVVRAKVTGGVMSDYTVLDGFRLTLGDMDGQSRTYGNGILLEDDSDMSGTCSLTTGININIGCATGINIGTCATGLTFTGTYVTTAIQIGTSGSNIVLAANDDHLVDIYATSEATGASIEPFSLRTTLTGVGAVGGRALFYLTSNAALGGWSNALKAQTVYGATGKTTGMGSAFCAELELSAGTVDGTYAPIEAEIVADTGCSTGTNTSFIYINGTDDSGLLNANVCLFELGAIFASGSANMWYDHQGGTPANVEEWIKVKTPAGIRYLALFDAVV